MQAFLGFLGSYRGQNFYNHRRSVILSCRGAKFPIEAVLKEVTLINFGSIYLLGRRVDFVIGGGLCLGQKVLDCLTLTWFDY